MGTSKPLFLFSDSFFKLGRIFSGCGHLPWSHPPHFYQSPSDVNIPVRKKGCTIKKRIKKGNFLKIDVMGYDRASGLYLKHFYKSSNICEQGNLGNIYLIILISSTTLLNKLVLHSPFDKSFMTLQIPSSFIVLHWQI